MALQPQTSRTAQLHFEQLLRNNDLGIIENPLRRIDEADLEEYIRDFYDHHSGLRNVVDVKLLIRGGRLARDEEDFVSQGGLSDPERKAVDKEKTSTIWQESKELKTILLVCFVASIVQGWTQCAIVGANQSWPDELGLDTGLTGPSRGSKNTADTWRFSATNAIVYFSASSLGAFLCDPLSSVQIGRRGALSIAALFTLAASIGAAYVHSWQALFVTRVLLGVGMGAKTSIVPVYESEVSPARLRGRFLVSWQTGTALGIAFSAIIPLIQPRSWRFQISSSFIPSLVLLFLICNGSESPRWLLKKGRFVEAYKVLERLRGNSLLAARDLIQIKSQLEVETLLFRLHSSEDIEMHRGIPRLDPEAYDRENSFWGYGRRIGQLFTIPRVRRSTVAALAVMSAQQLCGINIFVFLASTLFEYAHISSKHSLWLFFGFGIANVVSSAIAYRYIDNKGRRFLLITSLALMFPLLLATAFSFQAHENSVRIGLVTTFLILYALAYGPGGGVVPFLYTSEIFPQVLREVGMAWGSAVTFFGAGILALTVPQLTQAMGLTGLLGLFAGLDAIALTLVWLLMPSIGPEDSALTMEEMNYVFGKSTKLHVHYQLNEVAPYYFNRYIRRREAKPPPPLFTYDQNELDPHMN